MAKIPSTTDKPTKAKAESDFEKRVAAEVARQLAKASKVEKVLTQDQHDLLTIVAPNRAARHDYKIKEA